MILLFYLALLNLTLGIGGIIGDCILFAIYKLDGGKLGFIRWWKAMDF